MDERLEAAQDAYAELNDEWTFDDDAIPTAIQKWMANFAAQRERDVLRRVVTDLRQRFHTVKHPDGCSLCRYIAKLEKEAGGADGES